MITSSNRQPLYCQNTFYKQFLSGFLMLGKKSKLTCKQYLIMKHLKIQFCGQLFTIVLKQLFTFKFLWLIILA